MTSFNHARRLWCLCSVLLRLYSCFLHRLDLGQQAPIPSCLIQQPRSTHRYREIGILVPKDSAREIDTRDQHAPTRSRHQLMIGNREKVRRFGPRPTTAFSRFRALVSERARLACPTPVRASIVCHAAVRAWNAKQLFDSPCRVMLEVPRDSATTPTRVPNVDCRRLRSSYFRAGVMVLTVSSSNGKQIKSHSQNLSAPWHILTFEMCR
jgi:hypothetical protein